MSNQLETRDSEKINFTVKNQLIQTLVKKASVETGRALREFLSKSDQPIQDLATSDLIKNNAAWVIECLLPLLYKHKNDLHETDAHVGTMALEIIEGLAYDHIYLLIPLLHDQDELIRAQAADLLGLVGNPKAAEALIATLQDPSPRVRSSALASLGRLADEQAIPAIERLLQTEDDSWVIFSCIKSLERIGGRRATKILLDLLKQDDEFILAAAIESLGEIGSRGIIRYMLKTLAYPSARILERMSTALISILQRDGLVLDSSRSAAARLSKQTRADLISFFTMCASSLTINYVTRLRAIDILGKLKAEEMLAHLEN